MILFFSLAGEQLFQGNDQRAPSAFTLVCVSDTPVGPGACVDYP